MHGSGRGVFWRWPCTCTWIMLKYTFKKFWYELFGLTSYLCGITRYYFWDRVMLVQTASSMIRKEMTRGVPQGSVLGLLLRNIAYHLRCHPDGGCPTRCTYHLLQQQYPDGYSREWYSHVRVLGKKLNTTLEAMTPCIKLAGLSLAATKKGSDAVYTPSLVQSLFLLPKWGGDRACTALKYLGLWFDEKLTLRAFQALSRHTYTYNFLISRNKVTYRNDNEKPNETNNIWTLTWNKG